jgi:hypothetical protein
MRLIQYWDESNQRRADRAETRRLKAASGPAALRRAGRTAALRAALAASFFALTGVFASDGDVALAVVAGIAGVYEVGATALWVAVYRRRRLATAAAGPDSIAGSE